MNGKGPDQPESRTTGVDPSATGETGNGDDHPEVLVVGGGLAGLALAGFLHDRGWTPTVVERTAEWQRVGWGIGLWANGIAVLEELGVAETAIDRGTTPDRFEIRGGNGENLATVDLPDEDAFLAVHRADLHAALREAVPASSIRMDTAPASIATEGDRVRVEYEDGTADRVDAVVGADGIRSSVRELCFEDWTVEDAGTAVWSFWTDPGDGKGESNSSDDRPSGPAGSGLPEGTVSYWAPGTEAFVIDVDGRGLVNVATKLPVAETPDSPADALLSSVAEDLGGPFPGLVEGIDDDTTVFFDRNRTVEADTWHRGRVCLIGDAAHAVHPISGMGAALAFEDAYVLADELTSKASVEAAFEGFERRRRDRVAEVQRTARVELATAFAESSVATGVRDAVVRWTPAVEWFMDRQLAELTDAPLRSL